MKKIFLLFFILLFIGCKEKKIETFAYPISEKVKNSSEQGARNTIYSDGISVTNGLYHNAIDIPCKDKTPVYASKGGKVITVYPSYYNGEKWKGDRIYGGLIEIDHNDGTMTRYAHLSFTNVKEEQIVKKGDLIGWSGGIYGRRGSGISTGPHLHFEIILNIEEWLEY